jgi:hypothetical protein
MCKGQVAMGRQKCRGKVKAWYAGIALDRMAGDVEALVGIAAVVDEGVLVVGASGSIQMMWGGSVMGDRIAWYPQDHVRWVATSRTPDRLRDLPLEAEEVRNKGYDGCFQVDRLAFRDPNSDMMSLRNVE